MVGDGRRW